MKFYLLFVYLLNYLSDNEQQVTQIILPTYLIQCRGNHQIGDFITIVRSIVSKEYDYERNYYDVMLEAKYLAKWLCGAELEDKAEETENEMVGCPNNRTVRGKKWTFWTIYILVIYSSRPGQGDYLGLGNDY